MIGDPSLLVVDDEEVVCEGCRRIFCRQGFRVEKSSDPREGLSLAENNHYAAILLDIKMPRMDGIEFLQRLRMKKPELPVIFITGYPNVSSATSAVRLGACDYVTKPFTPEEITQAVYRSLRRGEAQDPAADVARRAASPCGPRPEFRFLDEAWMERAGPGPVRVGALLAPSEAVGLEAIRLPRPGEAVYQGLPLAGLTSGGQTVRSVPSPISGVVVAVNEHLQGRVSALWDDPFGSGWIARVSPTHFEKELGRCKIRRVLLANADRASAVRQAAKLGSLGCVVVGAASWEELGPLLADARDEPLVVDAASFAERGPALVREVRREASDMKIVVAGSAESPWEAAYRRHRIFYYAVEPFADNEIVEILDALFRPPGQTTLHPVAANRTSETLSSISITNRNGRKVCLLSPNGLLLRSGGVGEQIRRKLVDRLLPVRITFQKGSMTRVRVMLAAGKCDHLFVLMAKDTGRLPGALLRDSRGQFVSGLGAESANMTALIVQPDSRQAGLTGLDDRTASALAEHVVREMASC